ncbi:MAG: hypothetical protein KBD37_08770 [Burkholderiales bacterium]|nr:hypothetical protein [Burkholderiales bacterium]
MPKISTFHPTTYRTPRSQGTSSFPGAPTAQRTTKNQGSSSSQGATKLIYRFPPSIENIKNTLPDAHEALQLAQANGDNKTFVEEFFKLKNNQLSINLQEKYCVHHMDVTLGIVKYDQIATRIRLTASVTLLLSYLLDSTRTQDTQTSINKLFNELESLPLLSLDYKHSLETIATMAGKLLISNIEIPALNATPKSKIIFYHFAVLPEALPSHISVIHPARIEEAPQPKKDPIISDKTLPQVEDSLNTTAEEPSLSLNPPTEKDPLSCVAEFKNLGDPHSPNTLYAAASKRLREIGTTIDQVDNYLMSGLDYRHGIQSRYSPINGVGLEIIFRCNGRHYFLLQERYNEPTKFSTSLGGGLDRTKNPELGNQNILDTIKEKSKETFGLSLNRLAHRNTTTETQFKNLIDNIDPQLIFISSATTYESFGKEGYNFITATVGVTIGPDELSQYKSLFKQNGSPLRLVPLDKLIYMILRESPHEVFNKGHIDGCTVDGSIYSQITNS